MGLAVTEKLISAAIVEGEMKKGQRIGIRADQTLSHDVNGIMSYLVLEAMGVEKVKAELSVHYIDHNLIQGMGIYIYYRLFKAWLIYMDQLVASIYSRFS